MHLTSKNFLGLFCRVIWCKNFLIWLNPQISVPHQNRVSGGSRPRMESLGRVKAVMSNRERTLRLSQSGLLFCTSVEAICCTRFCWDSTVDGFLFLVTISSTLSDSEMTFDPEDAEIYYIAEDMKMDFLRPRNKMKTKLIYFLVFC